VKKFAYAVAAFFVVFLQGCFLIPVDGEGGTSELVEPERGTYLCTPDESAHIDIPPGALERPTTITIERVEPPFEIEEYAPIGPVFDFGPSGTEFAVPVFVQLRPGALPEGVSWDDVSLYSLSGGVIEELASVTVDPIEGTVSGLTTHFSVFFVSALAPSRPRGISVGGPGLVPFFGRSDRSDLPANIGLWFRPDGTVSTSQYGGEATETLLIQINSGMPNTPLYVEGWTIDPADPEGTVGPTGDRISTRGFWYLFFGGNVIAPLTNLTTDSEGRIALTLDARDIHRQMVNAPAGYSSGRVRLRAIAPNGPSAIDIKISFGRVQ
jgi:hypothetical protein